MMITRIYSFDDENAPNIDLRKVVWWNEEEFAIKEKEAKKK